MSKRSWLSPLLAMVITAGCQSVPYVQSAQPDALHSAQRRAMFDLACSNVQVEVLTSETIQPPVWVAPLRAEYTIGAIGCGQRKTYMVVCSDGAGGCVAVSGR